MKRLRSAASTLLALAALLTILAWATGAIATDRSLITQYLYWVPAWASLILAALLLLSARLIAVAPRRSSAIRALAWLGCILAGFYILLIDFRLYAAVQSPPPARLRILHWNITTIDDTQEIQRILQETRPDIAVLVDPWGKIDWQGVIAAFGPGASIAREPGMFILSKAPIRRWGFASLGLADLPLDAPIDWEPRPSRPSHKDPGRALFLEIHSPLLDRPQVLWVIDLPSDWRKSRVKLARLARSAIDNWSGHVARINENNHAWREPHDRRGFPPPDIIVGDFNIPRGSHSLTLLAPGMRHAFDQAGYGYAASFPNRRPLLHIDHTFLGPALRAVRYQLLKPRDSTHRVQVTDIAPSAKPRPPLAEPRP